MKPSSTSIVRHGVVAIAILAIAVSVTGCVSMLRHSKHQHRSSTVDFLYPDKESVQHKPAAPAMTLPVNVGIAFVPDKRARHGYLEFSEEERMRLAGEVAERFRGQPFIGKIEIIPSTYLKPGGGFTNLDQLRAMFDVEVIALVSFDQVQHSDERAYALGYLTVVGMYVINGDMNDTSTMMDTSVFHITSRKLLFRAPGISRIKGPSTMINLRRNQRKQSLEGIRVANQEMIGNLTTELDRFKKRIKERPDEIKITHSPGYKGGGNLGVLFPASMALLIGFGQLINRRRRE